MEKQVPKFKVGQEVGWFYSEYAVFIILAIKYVNDECYDVTDLKIQTGRYMYLIRYTIGTGALMSDWFYEMELKEIKEDKQNG